MRTILFLVAIVNVNVVPMTDDHVLRNQVVLVDGERITAVGAKATTPVPEGATVIDAQNGFLIPGLIDLHAHDDFGAPLFVPNGVTTVLLAGDGVKTLEADPAPRVIACGPSITNVKTAADAERIVEEQKREGFDCIKIYDDIDASALQPLVDAARKRGMLSIGHVPRNLTWQQMLAAKPDAIAHLEEFLYSPVDAGDDYVIAGQMLRNDVAVITTLTTYDTITRQVADLDAQLARRELDSIDPQFRTEWDREHNRYRTINPARVPNLRRLLTFQKDLAKLLHGAGVRVLAGTDSGGVPFVFPGSSMTDELRLLVSSGLTPYEALRAATANAATFIHREDLGTIKPGNVADLVLLRGDPLRDIDNVSLRAGVMARGRWLPSN